MIKNITLFLAFFFLASMFCFMAMNAIVQETEMREIQVEKLKGEN